MRNRLAAAGLECNAFPGAPKGEREDFDRESAHLAEWLRSLKPQTALYAAWDRRALQILSLCSELDIAVPESLSVLGTDNDEVLCESSTPSLSSIALDGRNAGILCAKLLDAHMNGRKAEPLVDLAFPRIVTRQSTDMTVVPDAYLAKALGYKKVYVCLDTKIEKYIPETHGWTEINGLVYDPLFYQSKGRSLNYWGGFYKDYPLYPLTKIRLSQAVELYGPDRKPSLRQPAVRMHICTRFRSNLPPIQRVLPEGSV